MIPEAKTDVIVLGIMSGTSLDGLDMALCRFNYSEGWSFQILEAITLGYDDSWLNRLTQGYLKSKDQLALLNKEYSTWLGQRAKEFISQSTVRPDFIASHGHTMLHEPDKGLTFQLGNLEEIATESGFPVICDFRVQDVALGGQGAPLVPVGDSLLFPEYKYCLNLGGFANVSIKAEDGQMLAFDIAPCNMLLNHISGLLGMNFDESGQIARSGRVIEKVLNLWNDLPFYHLNPPKSLGREWFEKSIQLSVLSDRYEPKDLLCTAVEHVAIQITKVLDKGNCLITGGGAKNTFLIERIGAFTECFIKVPDHRLVDYKEALVFGLLGVLRQRNEVNVLASVTGASGDHCSGKIYNA